MSTQRVFILQKRFYIHPVFTTYTTNKYSEIVNVKTQRILKTQKVNSGYCEFLVYDQKLEKPKKYLQHRFVFEAIKRTIRKGFVIDRCNNCKADNRLKNLQLLTPAQNQNKSHNLAIISINIHTGGEKTFISIKKAAIELKIYASNISKICLKRKSFKTAASKNDGQKYRFEFVKKN